jgi:lysine 6-dehydrogenase
MKIIVLGGGLVGSPIANDLVKENRFSVQLVDINEEIKSNLDNGIEFIKADLSSKENVKKLIESSDLVINAVPGFMGFKTVQAIIESGKNVVDIAFFSEDPFELDKLAKKNGVTAIVDCGVAPGMSNILSASMETEYDLPEELVIYVGGLPEKRVWPFEYRAVFSPIDVIEEYTRPARIVENGKLVIREALTELEKIDFPKIGTLEAFNSDGLRTLANTLKFPNMKEKTLRYPGHVELMRAFRDSGFFSYEDILINGKKVKPIDLSSKLLFDKWKMEDDDVDITVMQIKSVGTKNAVRKEIVYDLYDRLDKETNVHSMARTTGYTATVVARLFLEGHVQQKGIIVPEFLGKDKKNVDYILAGLSERGIEYKRAERIL